MISVRIRLLVLLVAALGFTACGGSDSTGPGTTDPDPDPPADPVPASVEVTPASDSLAAGGTLQLDAEVKDASGATLTGESVTWSSSDEAVATVSNAGEVTAVADGAARITATAGSASGTADLTVFTALAEISDAGGTVASTDGSATLEVPANALASPTAITASPIEAAAVAVGAVPGSAYEFGPDGLVFGTPATLTLAYEPDSLPAGADPTTLVLVRSDGSTLERLDGVAVDPSASTVQAQVPGFSSFAVCLPSEAALCGATPDQEVDLVVEDLFTVVGPDDGVSQGTPSGAPVALYQGKLVDVRNDGTAAATGVEIVFSTTGPVALSGLSLEFPEQGDPDEAVMTCQDTGTNQDGAVTAITCAVPAIAAGETLFDAVQGEVVVNAVVPFGTSSLAVDVAATSTGEADEASPGDNALELGFPYYETPAADLVATLTAPAETAEGQSWTLTFGVENTAGPQDGPTVDGLDALIQLDGVNFGQDLPAGCGLDQDLGSLAAVRCRFDGLAPGETRTFDFELGTGEATEIGATAVLQGWDQVVDTDSANNGDQAVIAVGQPVTDVSAALVASREPVQVGDTLTYTLTATNNGPDVVGTGTIVISASGPVDFPAGFQAPSGCATGSSGVGISCGFVNVASGESREYSLQVQATGGGEINASAGLLDLASSTDPEPANDIAEVVTTVTLPSVDLGYGVTRSPQDLLGGQSATFTFTVDNPSPDFDAAGVQYGLTIVGDVVPSAGWTVPAGCQLGSGGQDRVGVLCQATVPAGQTASEDLTVDIGSGETQLRVLGSLAATGSVNDPEPSNNEVDELVPVTPEPVETDLALDYALDPASPVAGAAATATVTLSNLGAEDAADVSWFMNFNNGVSVAPGYTPPTGCVLGTPGDPSVDGTGLLCSGVAVAAGGTSSASLALSLADTASVLEVLGGISDFGTVTDTNAANDNVSDQVALQAAQEDPLIVLDPDSVFFQGGSSEQIPVQLVQILNGGGGDLLGLDADVSYVSGSGWLIASVGVDNGQDQVFLQADPGGLATGTYRADVSILDPQASNSPETLPVVLEVLPEADLSVALSNTPVEVEAGQAVEYQVSVSNNGPSATTGADIRLRVEGTFNSPGGGSIPTGCTLSSDATPASTYDCALAGLAAGGNATLTLPLVAQVVGEELVATASIQAVDGASDPNAGNDQAQATTTVTAPPGTDLAIVADASANLTAGSPATVTFGVANNGVDAENANGVTSVLGLVGDLAASAQWTVPAGCAVENDPLQVGAALSLVCGPEPVTAGSAQTRDVVIDLAETATGLRVVAEITSTGDVTDVNPGNNALDETFSVAPPPEPPVLALSQDSVSFDALVDGTSPSPQTVFITNEGEGTLTGLTADVTYDAGQPTGWLTADVIVQPAPGDPFVSLLVDQTGLALGTYAATVSVTADGASNNPQELRVVVHVLPPADIATTLANVPGAVDVGTTITYQATVTNNGPSNADRVLVQLVVSGTLLAPGGSTPPDGCALFTSPPGADPAMLYQCTVENLGSGESLTFDLPLVPQLSGDILQAVTQIPDLQGAVDPNPLNDIAQAVTIVN